jgi:site-specific DNA-adenine methylase
MVRQFILNYQGTKYKESKNLDNIDFSHYKNIIEPFCGSFGFSRYLYSDRGYKDIKYIFYDSDEELINFYNHIKHLINNNMLEEFINEYNKYVDYFKDNFVLNDKSYKYLDRKLIIKYVKTIEDKFIVYMIYKNIIETIIVKVNYKHYKNLHIDDLDLIKNSQFIHQNFLTIDFTKYKKDTLLYLDPPYILSDNHNYKDKSLENIFEVILKLYKKKYNCMFIHSYNYLLNFVFKKYNYMSYEKKYGNTNNIVSHIVYYNP